MSGRVVILTKVDLSVWVFERVLGIKVFKWIFLEYNSKYIVKFLDFNFGVYFNVEGKFWNNFY